MRKRSGEQATNQKARRRKSDQSKSMPAENSVMLLQMRATNEKARQHLTTTSVAVPGCFSGFQIPDSDFFPSRIRIFSIPDPDPHQRI
jgi:hypothetical protein